MTGVGRRGQRTEAYAEPIASSGHCMDDAKLRHEYDLRRPLLERIKEEAVFTLKNRLAQEGIKVDDVTGRVKEFDSFQKKCRPLLALSEQFEEVRDLAGVRVVCLFLKDTKRVAEVINTEFTVLEVEDKTAAGEPGSFGYMGAHFIVQLADSCCGARYDHLKGLPFEIQVRTISQHAWAAISHHLSYKSATEVPSDLRKDFHALSGLFYVADMHFEMFFKQKQEAIVEVEKKLSTTDQTFNIELNKDTLHTYSIFKFFDKVKYDTPGSLSENFTFYSIKDYIKSISELDLIVKNSVDLALRYMDEAPIEGDVPASMLVFICCAISHEIILNNYLTYIRKNNYIDSEMKKFITNPLIKYRKIFLQRITPSPPPGTSPAAP